MRSAFELIALSRLSCPVSKTLVEQEEEIRAALGERRGSAIQRFQIELLATSPWREKLLREANDNTNRALDALEAVFAMSVPSLPTSSRTGTRS